MEFKLHEQLQNDTIVVGEFKLSLLLRIKDQNYPWYVLVPKLANSREIHHLTKEQRQQLHEESYELSKAMESFYEAEKLNVAALGNMVSQLHIHHVARYSRDFAWPKPIWGAHPMNLKDPDTFFADTKNFAENIKSDFTLKHDTFI